MNYPKLKALVEADNSLITEIANIISDNGTGDCYGCKCNDYCTASLSCTQAISLAVKDLLELQEGGTQ